MDLRKILEESLMAEPLPKFDTPPVVETVISLQFAPLAEYSTPHSGWFWKKYASKLGDWNRVAETPALPDQVETFGPGSGWANPGVQFHTGQVPARTQIIRADEERMIQIQNSRLILNWKRGTGRYPSYEKLLPEFKAVMDEFLQFVQDADLGDFLPTQWEMTYVNHMPRGELWSDFEEIPEIFTDIKAPLAGSPVSQPDTLNANWRYIIGDNEGRLYVSLAHAKVAPDDSETLRLQLVARGPVSTIEWPLLKSKFDLGHESIVRTFAAITTPAAHRFWKRRE